MNRILKITFIQIVVGVFFYVQPLMAADPQPKPNLTNGTYQVSVLVGGKEYKSKWSLKVDGNSITGSSEWDCCPGPRVDPLTGTINGNTVSIERKCQSQGYTAPCDQIYKGSIKGKVIEGNYTHNGQQAGTWRMELGGGTGGRK